MLKRLMLNKKLQEKRTALEGVMASIAELETREVGLAQAIEEANTDEEKAAVEEEVTKFENDKEELGTKKSALEAEISGIETEIGGLEEKAPKPAETQPDTQPQPSERSGGTNMEKRMFGGLTRSQMETLVKREEVTGFIQNVRGLRADGQTRAVTGGNLGIPLVVLDILRDNLHTYSKLIKHVTLKQVGGTARQLVAGSIPEGIWTEAVANINELALAFNMVEVDGFKVGGFIPIPNAILDDSDDIALANEILYALGQAIGVAVDKAILYGTGTKMPLGAVTRLAQATAPVGYPATAPAWVDLRTKNLLKFDGAAATAEKFFQDLLIKASAAKANFSNGQKFWAMNSNTYAQVMAKSINFNAAGALVAAGQGTMPIIGGIIEILEFIPDNDIVGGYGSLYLLSERADASIESSKEVRFLQDQTVFKGTARYDGKPVISAGFVVINIANAVPTTTATFAADTAN